MQKVEIKVRGQIDRNWTDWFGGLSIAHTPQGETVLAGSIRDQAELRGMLFRLADLGLELASVNTELQAHGHIREEGVINFKRNK